MSFAPCAAPGTPWKPKAFHRAEQLSPAKRKTGPRGPFSCVLIRLSGQATRLAALRRSLNRLVGHTLMVGAIGRVVGGLAAAEVEIVLSADRRPAICRCVRSVPSGRGAARSERLRFEARTDSDFLDRVDLHLFLQHRRALLAGDGAGGDAGCVVRRARRGRRALRCAGRASLVPPALARPGRLRRWTLPMTALRLTPPSCAAIWLALRPSAQSFFSLSTRSSVQFMPCLRLIALV